MGNNSTKKLNENENENENENDVVATLNVESEKKVPFRDPTKRPKTFWKFLTTDTREYMSVEEERELANNINLINLAAISPLAAITSLTLTNLTK